MPTMIDQLTEKQQRLLAVLEDGEMHHRRELMEVTGYESKNALYNSVCKIRGMMPPPVTILCVWYKKATYYRMVRLISRRD